MQRWVGGWVGGGGGGGHITNDSTYPLAGALTGFPRRLENRENENGQGKVREQAKMTKSQGIL